MGKLKQVDTGGLPFRELRSGDKFYVDKSLLIKDILDTNDRGVYLFTRPRRFGKSTNLTMLDAFFNMEYKGNDWFDGLEISGYPEYGRYRNAFPVVYLNLKGLTLSESNSTFDEFIEKFSKVVSDAYMRFAHLLDWESLNPRYRSTFRAILEMEASKAVLTDSIKDLTGMLKDRYGLNTILLIDEYDRAVTDTFDSDLLESVTHFMGSALSSALKDNPNLQMAYITGVTQVAKAGMFSGLNNLTVDNVFSTMSDERFGFTEREVEGILEYYGRPETIGEVREWYDGYRFGDAEVYNPFSVMMYVQNGFSPRNYWMGTSRDNPVRWMLGRRGSEDDISRLLSGSHVDCMLHDAMSYEELNLSRPADMYSLMVMTGYLRADPLGGWMFRLSIPNGEAFETLDRMVSETTDLNPAFFSDFCAAVLDGDSDAMTDALGHILAGSTYLVPGGEFPYEVMLLTMLRGILPRYDTEIEREAGNGRADLIMRPRDDGVPPMVIELKTASSEAALPREVDAALEQIHSQRYYLGMRGRAVLIGIAFWGKVPMARSETLALRRCGIRRRIPDHPAFREGGFVHYRTTP